MVETKASRNRNRKFKVSLSVTRLEGLGCIGGDAAPAVAAVEVRRRRHHGIFPFLASKRKSVSVSERKLVGNDGSVAWAEEGDEAARLENVSVAVPVSGSGSHSDVAFSVLSGYQGHGKSKENDKLEEAGTANVILAEWAQLVSENELFLQAQRKQVPITLRKGDTIINAMLYIKVQFMEVMATKGAKISPSTRDEQTSNSSNGSSFVDEQECYIPWSSMIENPDLHELLESAERDDKPAVYRRRSSAAAGSSSSSYGGSGNNSTPEIRSISKRRFLSWRRRSKDLDKIRAKKERESKKSRDSSTAQIESDPIGSWEIREIVSRDGETKLKAEIFFASIDQRDESAGGESACTALVAVFAHALLSKTLISPTKSHLDSLIRDGSLEWRKLCENPTYLDLFPNKHFDLDTVIDDARIRPISVRHERSFVAFFQPESFASLSGAMSFDDMWREVSNGVQDGHAKVYIVSWNDHFFILKIEDDAYYIIDTLGERLMEGCDKAYMLKFDAKSEMYKLQENGEDVLMRGKECCREFVTRFLAAIPLREELEMERNGGENAVFAPHQRLQIEFHFTVLREEDRQVSGL